MKQLAIVVPIYKKEFFHHTLESLAAQTCKDFTVYIGDDCSPVSFKELIDEYSDKLDIRYTRFEENLGAKDLVSQWARCVNLTEGEPWLWLFSDDDMMEPNCIELFYKQLQVGDVYDLFHFDVKVIDSQNNVVRQMDKFPDVIDSETFYRRKSSNTLDSFVVEYVFSRKVYEEVGGFAQFDMAWNSDIATWVKMGKNRGIKTIDGASVLWRQSGLNITPNHSKDMVYKKLNIDVDFIAWTKDFFPESSTIVRHNKYALFRLIVSYCQTLDKQQLESVLTKAQNKSIVDGWYKTLILIMLPLLRLARTLKHL